MCQRHRRRLVVIVVLVVAVRLSSLSSLSSFLQLFGVIIGVVVIFLISEAMEVAVFETIVEGRRRCRRCPQSSSCFIASVCTTFQLHPNQYSSCFSSASSSSSSTSTSASSASSHSYRTTSLAVVLFSPLHFSGMSFSSSANYSYVASLYLMRFPEISF